MWSDVHSAHSSPRSQSITPLLPQALRLPFSGLLRNGLRPLLRRPFKSRQQVASPQSRSHSLRRMSSKGLRPAFGTLHLASQGCLPAVLHLPPWLGFALPRQASVLFSFIHGLRPSSRFACAHHSSVRSSPRRDVLFWSLLHSCLVPRQSFSRSTHASRVQWECLGSFLPSTFSLLYSVWRQECFVPQHSCCGVREFLQSSSMLGCSFEVHTSPLIHILPLIHPSVTPSQAAWGSAPPPMRSIASLRDGRFAPVLVVFRRFYDDWSESLLFCHFD